MAQSTKNKLELYGPIAFALVGIVITVFLAGNAWPSLDYDTEFEEVVSVLGSLLVIALFLERALAVINDLLFDKARAQDETDAAAERLEFETTMLTFGTGEQKAIADYNLPKIQRSYELAVAAEEELDSKRQRLRLGVGFVIAVLIAGVGVRSLGELVEPPPEPNQQSESQPLTTSPPPAVEQPAAEGTTVASPSALTVSTATAGSADEEEEDEDRDRRDLFDWLDILLTAGLLAGGSNGIGALIDAINLRRPKPTGPGSRLASRFVGLRSYPPAP